jgi:DNA repair and recombination protein RAD52
MPPQQRPSTLNLQGPNGLNNQPNRLPQPAGEQPPAGPSLWFSAKAVQEIPESSLAEGVAAKAPIAQQAFNPKAESPSIRKTEGFNHSRSHKVVRAEIGQSSTPPPAGGPGAPGNNGAKPPTGLQQQPQRPGNVVNPHLDQTRQVGVPGGRASPMANRGQYRPPTMKRPMEAGGANGRPALAEVPANAGPDVKRLKMG